MGLFWIWELTVEVPVGVEEGHDEPYVLRADRTTDSGTALEGLFEEQSLAVEGVVSFFRAEAGIGAVGVQLPGVRGI